MRRFFVALLASALTAGCGFSPVEETEYVEYDWGLERRGLEQAKAICLAQVETEGGWFRDSQVIYDGCMAEEGYLESMDELRE